MKITKQGTCTVITASVEGVEIGQIKLNAEVQISTYDDSNNHYFDLLDWSDITYMGMTVDDTKELFKFHKTLGIDLQNEIHKAIDKLFTEDVLDDLLNKNPKAVTYHK